MTRCSPAAILVSDDNDTGGAVGCGAVLLGRGIFFRYRSCFKETARFYCDEVGRI